jgi:hypothetical protein
VAAIIFTVYVGNAIDDKVGNIKSRLSDLEDRVDNLEK